MRKTISLLILISISAILMSQTSFAASWYADASHSNLAWRYRQKITINHSSVSGELTAFPVLVKITSASNPVFTKALPSDWDILFTASDGASKITHEVEYYNSNTDTLCAWVRVPNISATTDATIYMYYGCPNATTQESKTGVWDSNYVNVQHFKETSGQHFDSTSKGNNSTVVNVTSEGTQIGTIDGADSLNGVSNYDDFPTTGVVTSAGTISILAYELTSHGATQSYMVSSRVTSTTGRLYLLELNGTFEIGFSTTSAAVSTFLIPLNTWHYYALTWSGSVCAGYADGNLVTTAAVAVMPSISNECVAGALATKTSQWFNGIFDELRMSSSQRSQQWLKSESNSMLSPGAFCSFAAEEERPSVTIIGSKEELPQSAEYIDDKNKLVDAYIRKQR